MSKIVQSRGEASEQRLDRAITHVDDHDLKIAARLTREALQRIADALRGT